MTGRNSPVTPRTKKTKPPTDDRYRVLRGGGWSYSVPSLFRSAFRGRSTPAYRNHYLGFRCAQRGVRQPLTGG